MSRLPPVLLAVILATAPLAACGDDADPAPVIEVGDGGDYEPDVEASELVDHIDNPYLSLLPGSRWVYEGTSDGEEERIEVVVTDEHKTVMGVEAVVVRDTVTKDGELVEDTRDWYAQDREGNVWYLGEETAEYEDGEVTTTEGSWEAGRDGALPGIAMLAEPEAGRAYRQEFYRGEAEDLAEVVRVDELVVIREWNPFEPDVVEEKSYRRGVGMVLERSTKGGDDRFELVSAEVQGRPVTLEP